MYFVPKPRSFSTTPNYGSLPYFSGYNMEIIDNFTFTISPGIARDLLSDFAIAYNPSTPGASGSVLVDTTKVGLNGCYPYALSSLGLTYKTVFPVYVISNSGGITASRLNPSTNPSVIVATGDEFLPPGFNAYRRIGFVYIDDVTTQVIRWAQSGAGAEKYYLREERDGVVSGVGAVTYTPFNLSNADHMVPPKNNMHVQLYILFDAEDITNAISISRDAQVPYSYIGITNPTDQLIGLSCFDIIAGQDANGDAQLFYLVQENTSSAGIYVMGFYDNLDNSYF